MKIIESIDGKEIKNLDQFDYAKFLNLRGLIFYENGYNSIALTNFNLAAINFKELTQDPFDPFLINNKFDEILGKSLFCSNFEESKNEILELISMSQLLNNDFLVIKGFLTLSNFYAVVGNYRQGFAIARYAWDLSKKKNFKSDFVVSRIIYTYMLYNELQKKTALKDEVFLKVNSENNDFIKNQFKELEEQLKLKRKPSQKASESSEKAEKEEENNSKNDDKQKEFNLYKHPLHLAQILYLYGDYFYQTRSLYKSLFFLDKAIEILEKNNYQELHLVLYYVKKWVVLNHMGREATADHLMEHTQKLINKLYGPDSLKNLEYLRFVQINSSNTQPPRQDIVNEIIKKTQKVNDVENVNSFLTKFFNVLSLVNSKAGVPEIIEIYKEFDKLEKKIFGNKQTDLGADVKTNLILRRLRAVLKVKN